MPRRASSGTRDPGRSTRRRTPSPTRSTPAGASNTTLSNKYGSANLSLSGSISGPFSLNETGAGIVVLSGANSFTGGTTVAAGVLSISRDNNLGASAGGVTLNGGTLQFTGTGNVTAVAASRTITLGTLGGTIDTSNLSANGNQTTIAATIVSSGSPTTLTIKAHGDTSDTGNGASSYLDLTGTNTFTGGVTISSGLVVARDAAFGNAANTLTINGVGGLLASITGESDIARPIVLSGTGNRVFRAYGPGTSTLKLTGIVSGTGTLDKTDGGVLILTNSNNSYSGGTNIGAGTLQIGAGTTGSLGSGAVTDNGTLAFDLSGNATVAGVISGSGSLTQSGSGTTDLQGANTFTGTTTVNAGFLVGDGPNDMSGALGSSSTITVNNGGTLESGSNDNSLLGKSNATTGAILLNAGGTLTVSLNTTTNHLRTVTLAGGILDGTGALAGDAATFGRWVLDQTVTVQGSTNATSTIEALGVGLSQSGGTQFLVNKSGANPDLAVTGTFSHLASSADNGFVKTGTGTMNLSGANTYTGGTTVSAGTLQLGDGTTDGSIAGLSIVDNATLVINNANDLTYAGIISGSGSLTKSSGGLLTLTGTNTYSGTTTISGGVLQFGDGTTDGSIANSSGIVDNATLVFNDVNAVSYSGNISGIGNSDQVERRKTSTLTALSSNNLTLSVSAGILAAGGSVGPLSVSARRDRVAGRRHGDRCILSTGTASFVSAPFDVSCRHQRHDGRNRLRPAQRHRHGHPQWSNAGDRRVADAHGRQHLRSHQQRRQRSRRGDVQQPARGGRREQQLPGKRTGAARITYAGGDGNDVAIIVDTPRPRSLPPP